MRPMRPVSRTPAASSECSARRPTLTAPPAGRRPGHPDRVVGYNCWILPKPTDFQDFYTGEIGLDEAEGFIQLPE